jgi:hypothetical protein
MYSGKINRPKPSIERTGLKIPEADNRKLYTMQGLIAYLAR